MSERRPFILDVDTGIDDALALLYVAASPEVELVAATCVGGNVDAPQVAANTSAVLELAGRGDVEVALGALKPLLRPLRTTPETHGPHGLGYAALPAASRSLSTRTAADLIVAEARRRPGELTLVATGPLTNVALACLAEPELPRLLARFVWMGGAYRTAGNTSPTTEWNATVDPEAAKIVFDAFAATPPAARPQAFGLDVTETAVMLPEHLAALEARAGATPGSNRVLRFVADALRFYMEFHERFDGFYGAHVHDPLAAASAISPDLVRRWEPVTVDVEVAGILTAGTTVADWRHHWARPPNVDVVVEADVPAFFARWIERVGALAAKVGGVAS